MTLITILLPVFGLILLGALLQSIGFLDLTMESVFNRFCYFISLPVFILVRVATSPLQSEQTLYTTTAFLLVTLGIYAVGALMGPIFQVPTRSRGTFTQCGFRANLAYIGLPVLLYALLDQPKAIQEEVAAEAMLAIGGAVLLYNLLAVVALEWDRRHERGGSAWRQVIVSTIQNPLIIACIIGFLWNKTSLPVPDWVQRMTIPIGATAFPLALLAIGARIRRLPLRSIGLPVLGACLLKNGIALGVALLVCNGLNLGGMSRLIVLVLSACPTAVATYVLVDQLEGDRELAASAIAFSSLLSVLSLAGALALGM